MAWPCYCFLWIKFMPVSNATIYTYRNTHTFTHTYICMHAHKWIFFMYSYLIYKMQPRINYYISYVYILSQIFAFLTSCSILSFMLNSFFFLQYFIWPCESFAVIFCALKMSCQVQGKFITYDQFVKYTYSTWKMIVLRIFNLC